MIYKVRIILDTKEDIFRDIEIDASVGVDVVVNVASSEDAELFELSVEVTL